MRHLSLAVLASLLLRELIWHLKQKIFLRQSSDLAAVYLSLYFHGACTEAIPYMPTYQGLPVV